MIDAITEAVRVLVENGELHTQDAVLGRYLTRLPLWSGAQSKAAARMVGKYVARLRGYGIRASDLLAAEQARATCEAGASGRGGITRLEPGNERGTTQPGGRPGGPSLPGTVGVNCTAFTVRFVARGAGSEAVKLLPAARWDPATGNWRVGMTVAGAERLLEFAETYGLAIEPEVFSKIDELTGAALEAAAASRDEAAEYVVPDVHKTLRPYQQAGVRYLVEVAKGRALLCDEMGLGKTIESLAAVKAMDAFPLLIVCPASLKWNWKKEVKDVLGIDAVMIAEEALALTFRVVDKRGKLIPLLERRDDKPGDRYELIEPNEYGTDMVRARVKIINYDMLRNDWLAILSKCKLGAVILDESHAIKDNKSQRSQAVRKICRRVPVRFALTGTPVINQVADLLPQLSAIGRLEELGGFWHFAERYCGAKKMRVRMRGGGERFVWDLSGRSNVEELHERLRATCYLRRLKKHVLTELPPKQRCTVPIALDNEEEYRRAEADITQWLARKVAADKDFLASVAGLPERARIAAIEERHLEKVAQIEDAEALLRFEVLKQLCVKGKLAAAKAWITTFLESGQKLGVFAEHVDVVKGLAEHFGAPAITGDTPTKERQAIVERFQSDPLCELVVANTKAGGVGLTLTAASNCAFLELPWTSAAVDQAEDRFHRFGQRKSVTCYYLMGKGSIDWEIYGIIRAKRELVDAATDGKGAGDGTSAVNVLAELMRGRLSADRRR